LEAFDYFLISYFAAKTAAGTASTTLAHELTLGALRRTMNQLKEEITRFECRSGSAKPAE
jgi:hypothetical protein